MAQTRGASADIGNLSISPKDISVVIQGDIRADTLACIASVYNILPGAEVILATYETSDIPNGFSGRVVRIEDPGDDPPITCNMRAPRSNTNRQIATTNAGLGLVSRRFTLKLRSDAVLMSDKMLRLWCAAKLADPDQSRLVIPSFFTRNPHGISGYLFHASDWVMFGETTRVRSYWDRPFVPKDDIDWFDTRRHKITSTLSARRIRARLTPEQHLTVGFAEKLGYRVPRFFNDRSKGLCQECERFYARECIIASPDMLGFALPKYQNMIERPFQKLDNVLMEDWLWMCRTYAREISSTLPEFHCTWRQIWLRRFSLMAVKPARHLVSACALYAIRRRRIRSQKRDQKR